MPSSKAHPATNSLALSKIPTSGHLPVLRRSYLRVCREGIVEKSMSAHGILCWSISEKKRSWKGENGNKKLQKKWQLERSRLWHACLRRRRRRQRPLARPVRRRGTYLSGTLRFEWAKLVISQKCLQIFGGLVLGCIKTKLCKKICVWLHFSSSTRFAYFCTAAISKF